MPPNARSLDITGISPPALGATKMPNGLLFTTILRQESGVLGGLLVRLLDQRLRTWAPIESGRSGKRSIFVSRSASSVQTTDVMWR